jgi:acylphosphatase
VGTSRKPAISSAVWSSRSALAAFSVTRDTLAPLAAVTVIGVGSVDGDPYVFHYGPSSSAGRWVTPPSSRDSLAAVWIQTALIRPLITAVCIQTAVLDHGAMTRMRMTAWVHGQVQGVGFRWWTRCRALELGLVGHAANLSDGRVEVVAEGSREACERLLAALRSGSTPGHVQQVTECFTAPRGALTGFIER